MAKKKGHEKEDISFELLDEEAKKEAEISNDNLQASNSEKDETNKTSKQAKNAEEKHTNGAEQALRAEIEEYKNLLQLSRAEFDNYRKRSLALMQNAKTEGELNVIVKFLPALDAFDKAKEMILDANVLKGVEMIEKDIKDKLKALGVEEMNPLGKMFDANYHNALSTTCNPELEDEIITQVYQEGYMYNGKVIRYAQVIINKK